MLDSKRKSQLILVLLTAATIACIYILMASGTHHNLVILAYKFGLAIFKINRFDFWNAFPRSIFPVWTLVIVSLILIYKVTSKRRMLTIFSLTALTAFYAFLFVLGLLLIDFFGKMH